MKILVRVQVIICLMLFCSFMQVADTDGTIHAEQQQVPPYAKWGQIAMQKTKEKYPNAKIVDYLHIGRAKGNQTSIEKFKLWLKEGQKEFGVFVDIRFNNETEQLVDIRFRETDR
ncbi:DUF3889 domain-containing protein [Bacillus carboniphilus]|uniref:DUF3889 domain-containing protein n=1 Tax=Bacillus carboniphilus TaxID=86663 RepID=A0ABN0WQW8_9BACI